MIGITAGIAMFMMAGISGVPKDLCGVRTIVTLGDSITQGGGQPGGYVWLLQRYLDALYPERGIRIVNAGISGHKSTDMAARFERDVLAAKPDLVTISVGVNDVWHGFFDFSAGKPIPLGDGPNGVPLPVYRQKVDEMIRAAKQAGARPVILSATVVHEDLSNRENARIGEYNYALRELARKHGIQYVDLFGAFRKVLSEYQKQAGKGINLLTTDGVHLNAAGNRLMAVTILRKLGVPATVLERAGPNIEAALKARK